MRRVGRGMFTQRTRRRGVHRAVLMHGAPAVGLAVLTLGRPCARAVTPRARPVTVPVAAIVKLVRLVDTSMMAGPAIPVKCAQQTRIVALASFAPSRSLTPTRAQAVTPRAPRVTVAAAAVVKLVRPTDILTTVLRDPTVLYARKTRTVQIRSFVTLEWLALTRASRRRGIAGGVPTPTTMDLKL